MWCAGPEGRKFYVVWDKTENGGDGQYEFLAVANMTQDVITAWRFDPTTKQTQQKTRHLAGNWDGDESSWVEIDDTNCATPCP